MDIEKHYKTIPRDLGPRTTVPRAGGPYIVKDYGIRGTTRTETTACQVGSMWIQQW